jgi:hypothetical protein
MIPVLVLDVLLATVIMVVVVVEAAVEAVVMVWVCQARFVLQTTAC